jgi:hypothetical protein
MVGLAALDPPYACRQGHPIFMGWGDGIHHDCSFRLRREWVRSGSAGWVGSHPKIGFVPSPGMRIEVGPRSLVGGEIEGRVDSGYIPDRSPGVITLFDRMVGLTEGLLGNKILAGQWFGGLGPIRESR